MHESVLNIQPGARGVWPLAKENMAPDTLRAILDASPDCIKVLDEHGLLLSINQSGCRLMEIDDFSVCLNRPWSNFWDGVHREAAENAFRRALAGHTATFSGLCPTVRGTPKWWEVIVTPIESPPGELRRFLIVSRDITERRADEEKLRVTLEALEKNAEELRRSNQDLQQFAFIASHDLKSPLNAIIQLAELLSLKYDPALDDKGRQLTYHITESAQKMRVLINDLLDYSRVLAGPAEDHAGAGARELEHALENLKSVITENGALISFDHIPQVRIGPVPLMQVFQNLIGNALKYRGTETPRIEITTRRQADQWLFAIADNGLGIDPKFYERIFEPFQRLHGSDLPGSGIGLALCRKVIERAGGIIWVQSEPQAGSTFFFTLPAV